MSCSTSLKMAIILVGVIMFILCLGWAGGHYHIWMFMYFISTPQTYWTAVLVARATAGAQNCHNTARHVSIIILLMWKFFAVEV